MSTFDNLCEVLPYIQNATTDIEKDKRKKAIEETIKFLIKHRNKQYTFTELAEAIFQNTKEKVRMSFHGQGITGDSVGTNYVLASANEVLSYFWNYKQGNKQFKTPPISSNVVTTGNKSNMGAWGFVKDYLEAWYEESEYQKHTTDGTCDEFVREQIRKFDRWDNITKMLFEEDISLNNFLDEDVSKCTSAERQALHNIMQLKLIHYLQQYEPKKRTPYYQ